MLAGRAPLPFFLAFQLKGACVQQRFLERQELLIFVGNCASNLFNTSNPKLTSDNWGPGAIDPPQIPAST